MKSLAMAAAWLTVTICVSNGASVDVIGIQPASQNARITVLMDGKTQKDVKVTVTTTDGQPKASLVSDSRGVVRLPTLLPGNYCVTASAPSMRRSEICLAISSHHGKKRFSMILAAPAPPSPTFDEKLQTAEKKLPGEKTRHLAGVVKDVLGAVIPGAQVEIMPYGSRDLAHTRKAVTDIAGQFSYPLEPGSYTVIFKAPGFETKILVFDVFADAAKDQVGVKMEVGVITE